MSRQGALGVPMRLRKIALRTIAGFGLRVRPSAIPQAALAVFFLLIPTEIFASSGAGGAVSRDGDILVIASIGEASNLIPILASDSASQEVTSKVFSGLLKYDAKLELVGDLAESWEILDGGKTIVFRLRPGVLWHDGRPFTAADVEFTFHKLTDPAVPTPYGGDFLKVTAFEVPDDRTVRVRYAEPFAPALASWTMPVMPKHLLENEDLMRTRFARAPVGTGPFRFKRWLDGDRIELAAFERYFEGRPRLGVMLRVIPDQTTLFLELHQETVDLAGLTPVQYLKLTATPFFERSFRKYRYPSLGYTYLGYNLEHEFFREKKIRQALNLAVDKREIVDGVLLGLGRPATGPFTLESWARDPSVAPAPFDPAKARELLAEAGFEDRDGDGVVERDGKKFEFTMITNQGNFQRLLAAQIIQRRLADVGVSAKIKVVEWSAFLKEFIDARRFDAVLLAWGLSLDPDPHDIWHSSKTGKGEFNFICYRNPEADALIEAGRRTFDREERAALYRRLHRILYDDQPVMFLFVPDALPILSRRFRNIEVSPIGITHNLWRWVVPAAERRYTRYEL